MTSFEFDRNDKEGIQGLYGWMSRGCVEDDTALSAWVDTAEPGDYYEHRLGMCFCVN